MPLCQPAHALPENDISSPMWALSPAAAPQIYPKQKPQDHTRPSHRPTAIHTHGCHSRSFPSKLQVSVLAMGKSARGGVLRAGIPPDSSNFPRWLLQPPGEAITTIPSSAVSKLVLLGFCIQGSTTCLSFCLHHIRVLTVESFVW